MKNNLFFFENSAVNEIMWKKKYGWAGGATDGKLITRMRFARWMPKATNTHSEYVMLSAFPWQQWLG